MSFPAVSHLSKPKIFKSVYNCEQEIDEDLSPCKEDLKTLNSDVIAGSPGSTYDQ